jgi:hypothetical protein
MAAATNISCRLRRQTVNINKNLFGKVKAYYISIWHYRILVNGAIANLATGEPMAIRTKARNSREWQTHAEGTCDAPGSVPGERQLRFRDAIARNLPLRGSWRRWRSSASRIDERRTIIRKATARSTVPPQFEERGSVDGRVSRRSGRAGDRSLNSGDNHDRTHRKRGKSYPTRSILELCSCTNFAHTLRA